MVFDAQIDGENELETFLFLIELGLDFFGDQSILGLESFKRQVDKVFFSDFQHYSVFIDIQSISSDLFHAFNSWKFKFNGEMTGNFFRSQMGRVL